jgi:hypothetical protein
MRKLEGMTLGKTQEFERGMQSKTQELESKFLPFIFFVIVLLPKKR